MKLLLLLVACQGKDKGDAASGIDDLNAVISEVIPTVATVSWTTEQPTTGQVRFGPDLALSTPMEAVASTEHSAVLVGMSADRDHDWQVVLEDGRESALQTLHTGGLSNALPALTVTGSGQDRFLVSTLLGGVTGPVILNKDGEIVWFTEDTSGLDVYRARLSRDGDAVIYNAGSVSGEPADDSALIRVSLTGEEVTRIPVPLLAHDFVELPDGAIVAIVVEVRGEGEAAIRGDSLVEISPDGAATTLWSAWDCFDPEVDVGTDTEIGWTFANALDYDEEDDAFYLSIRNFSSIVKIPAAGGACDWVFGSTAATLPAPSPPFLHEHQFQVLDDSILIFDNAGAGSQSRAVEYSLDPSGATAPELIWSYAPSPSIFTFVLGDVARLEDGDTLVDFAVGGAIDRVRPDGERVWRVETPLTYAFGFMTPALDLVY